MRDVEILAPREVPLGGPRSMTVLRTLPQRRRSLIGAWCFADHYGPDDVSRTGGMDVAPHPHIGLQTVSWLFRGEIAHIDSGGGRGEVLPGEVNLMTAGDGIAHSETSTAPTTVLHGVQLWLALPESRRASLPRRLEHYAPPEVDLPGGCALVLIGSLLGSTSPVEVHTPLVGAEIRLDPGARLEIDVDPGFEHGVLVDCGEVDVEGVPVPRASLAYLGVGAERLHLRNAGGHAARVMLLGGEPFEEEIVMWWNFVGRTSEEIHRARADWEAGGERFGEVAGYVGHGGPGRNAHGQARLPAPAIPPMTLRPRSNPAPHARTEPAR
ncbi:pirin [Brachybacterium phenoliresistens]|uniref:Pirin n=1 Tax=Brachybacterium phenoliresistens TaxID=396014 RepID=Z9JVK0_9MICO|nr:pirin family protein [Brachybacterium phenoliresistens]EWS82224.1 pirin [Brachybacterium phenoliresistens]